MLIAKNTFIQMSKLTNVKGRINYISRPVRQENLYAVYETTERKFWKELAKCNQEEFEKSGTEGQCIEARELIIALPKGMVYFDTKHLLSRLTSKMKEVYKVECISALHHNKRKTNYHIHLIFSERKKLKKPIEKIATRNMFYNEQGKHVRTKKEILDGDGNVRKRCKIIPKGEVYERSIFTKKEEWFKSKDFLNEIKILYINEINTMALDEGDILKVFNRDSPYLATKKIGKNNPHADEIKEDNKMRQEWNQTVDQAYLAELAEAKIMSIKKSDITDKVKASISKAGHIVGAFRNTVQLAICVLERVIGEKWKEKEEVVSPRSIARVSEPRVEEIEKTKLVKVETVVPVVPLREEKPVVQAPQKPYLVELLPLLEGIRNELIMIDRSVKDLMQQRNVLETRLANLKGIFSGKERKEVVASIESVTKQIQHFRDEISNTIISNRYKNMKDFLDEYNSAVSANEGYRDEVEDYLENRYRKSKNEYKEQGKQSVLKQLDRRDNPYSRGGR